MCASPGGKTSHIAAIAGDSSTIIAFDKNSKKVARMNKNLEKYGINFVHSFVMDSTKCI